MAAPVALTDASPEYGSELFDDSGDEEDLPRSQRSRLSRGDKTSTWHATPAAPHRCYLVEWDVTPLQLSWVWMKQLDKPSTRYMSKLVDEWKTSGATNLLPDLVTMEMWDAYEDTRLEAIQYGVSCDDVTEFFKHLQRHSVPLNYDVMLFQLQVPAS
ncbi:hypothetical protein PF002_g2510 [Phytophthora fragariae]|uniref:Uncharacterized protein n=1 Tax=Phytophthora fragariae TaxID=53985 RepID=A0A6A4A9N7_9STRA|nr:hypothetical protein PF002_g2510 [Phytophthora fragariae]